MKQKKLLSTIGTVFFTILCFTWVLPVLIVLMDSFKSRTFISLQPFNFPTELTFVGLENYMQAIDYTDSSTPWAGRSSSPWAPSS